jgi:hypothetical protein
MEMVDIQTQAGAAARARKICVVMLDSPEFSTTMPRPGVMRKSVNSRRGALDFAEFPTILSRRRRRGRISAV